MIEIFFGFVLGALSVPAHPMETFACGTPEPTILEHRGEVKRRLRGDWEFPDVVALTYSTAWPDALESMLGTLGAQTDVLLLLPADVNVEEVLGWFQLTNLDTRSIEIAAFGVETGWIRDYGPLQTTNSMGQIIWLDADYSSRPDDDVVPAKLAQYFGVPVETIPEGLEGGAIISNGEGLCVSTIESFDDNRIPVDDPDASDLLLEQLGCQVLALVPALSRDPTKHADMFAQFMGRNTLALASFDAIAAPDDARRMNQAAAMITRAALILGFSLKIVRIPHPEPQGELYYSYLNGLRVGNNFLIPQYTGVDLKTETAAYEAFGAVGPHLSLLPIPADDMITLNGAVHCVTLGLSIPRTWLAASTADGMPNGKNIQ